MPGDRKSELADIINARGLLPAVQVTAPQTIERGHIYVAPPDHHLIIDGSRVLAWRGPREDRHRPAINALFRSAAVHYGARVAGVVLSGILSDGSAGMWWIKHHGGVAIVQDPSSARFCDMP